MKWILISVLFAFAGVIVNCEDNLVGRNDPGEDTVEVKKDTSIFIGKWVQVFDTSSQEKKDYWCKEIVGCLEPLQIHFVNDSLYDTAGQFGGSSKRMYRYTEDTLIKFIRNYNVIGNSTTYYDTLHKYIKYRMVHNDTVIFNENDNSYSAPYSRIKY